MGTGKKRSKQARRLPSKAPADRALQYKVLELSTVDEASLERGINDWVGRGWTLDGVQFAMRESSKRPAMAFILFTRAGEVPVPGEGVVSSADDADARERLARLAEAPRERQVKVQKLPVSAHQRLRELAGEGEE